MDQKILRIQKKIKKWKNRYKKNQRFWFVWLIDQLPWMIPCACQNQSNNQSILIFSLWCIE